MSSLLEKFARKHLANLNEGREIPDFKAGDTVEVHVRIIEGSNSRIQIFTGVCLRRRNSQHGGAGSTFTVKKVSNGEIVERTFLLHSPIIAKIKLLKVGRVRRAKLYYMRYLSGKAARIKELNKFENKSSSGISTQQTDSKIDSSASRQNAEDASAVAPEAQKKATDSSTTAVKSVSAEKKEVKAESSNKSADVKEASTKKTDSAESKKS